MRAQLGPVHPTCVRRGLNGEQRTVDLARALQLRHGVGLRALGVANHLLRRNILVPDFG